MGGILNDKERAYLRSFLKPFEITLMFVRKVDYGDEYEQLNIKYANKLGEKHDIAMSIFEKGTMYKGMSTNIWYTSGDLGL